MNKTLTPPPSQFPAASEFDVLALLSNPKTVPAVIAWAYPQLHDIALHCFRQEAPGRTLQPTAVLNEACLRLLESNQSFVSRAHFFGSAARSMRQILVNSARGRAAKKRGGAWRRVDFSYAERMGFERPDELIDFDAALAGLERVNPKWAKIVDLRVFAGFSTAEAAAILGIAEATARNHWAQARVWLRLALQDYAPQA